MAVRSHLLGGRRNIPNARRRCLARHARTSITSFHKHHEATAASTSTESQHGGPIAPPRKPSKHPQCSAPVPRKARANVDHFISPAPRSNSRQRVSRKPAWRSDRASSKAVETSPMLGAGASQGTRERRSLRSLLAPTPTTPSIKTRDKPAGTRSEPAMTVRSAILGCRRIILMATGRRSPSGTRGEAGGRSHGAAMTARSVPSSMGAETSSWRAGHRSAVAARASVGSVDVANGEDHCPARDPSSRPRAWPPISR